MGFIAKNEHTGQSMISKPNNKAFEEGWDRIFKKKDEETSEEEKPKQNIEENEQPQN